MDHGETGVVHWDQRLTDDELFDLYSARSDWFKAIRKVLPSQQYPQSPNLYSSSSMKRWKVLA